MLKFLGNQRTKATSKKSLFKSPSRRTPCGQGQFFSVVLLTVRLFYLRRGNREQKDQTLFQEGGTVSRKDQTQFLERENRK